MGDEAIEQYRLWSRHRVKKSSQFAFPLPPKFSIGDDEERQGTWKAKSAHRVLFKARERSTNGVASRVCWLEGTFSSMTVVVYLLIYIYIFWVFFFFFFGCFFFFFGGNEKGTQNLTKVLVLFSFTISIFSFLHRGKRKPNSCQSFNSFFSFPFFCSRIKESKILLKF